MLVARQRCEVAVVTLGDSASNVADIRSAVAVIRGWLAEVTGEHAARETVDLRAVIIEVVLAGDIRPLGLQHPGEAVADGRPTHAAHVDGAGRVGRDEFEVDLDARVHRASTVGGASIDDGLRERTGGGRFETDVDEARAGHFDGCHAGELLEPRGQLGGYLARSGAKLLGDLHRNARCPVAVVAIARTFDGDVGEGESKVDPYRVSLASAFADVLDEIEKGLGEFGRSHCTIVPAPPVGKVNG